jgi:hypothetical protein
MIAFYRGNLGLTPRALRCHLLRGFPRPKCRNILAKPIDYHDICFFVGAVGGNG